MAETDTPLKIFTRYFIKDVAAWLLQRTVLAAHELSTELASEPLYADLLFELTLDDGQDVLLHLEFQGRSSSPSMPLRELLYLARLTAKYNLPKVLESFVIYVEKNAGSADTGSYQVMRLDGSPAIAWRYTPIALWKTPANVLLALEKPSVVPLAALMKIEDPKATAEKMVEIVHRVENEEERRLLWASTISLMSNKECLEMIQQLIGNDTLLLDTPFLMELREKAESDGYTKGTTDGYTKGTTDGYTKGTTDGYTKGKEDGKEDGKDLGMREGLLISIDLTLEKRFGLPGLQLTPEIHTIKNLEAIKVILHSLHSESSLDEIRNAYLPYAHTPTN
jgi:predicted transposase YdaD